MGVIAQSLAHQRATAAVVWHPDAGPRRCGPLPQCPNWSARPSAGPNQCACAGCLASCSPFVYDVACASGFDALYTQPPVAAASAQQARLFLLPTNGLWCRVVVVTGCRLIMLVTLAPSGHSGALRVARAPPPFCCSWAYTFPAPPPGATQYRFCVRRCRGALLSTSSSMASTRVFFMG